MKLSSTLRKRNVITVCVMLVMVFLIQTKAYSQITTVCTDPNTYIYGLTGNGEIYEINMNTAATGTVVKNNTYSGNSPQSANGLGYNFLDGKFYYFKRNVTASPQEFVSFSPTTGVVTVLATSTCTDDIHTGCISSNGKGYYVIDIQGTLSYYNIVTNTWTFITSTIVDQNGNDVDSVIRAQNAGDMAIDGWGNIWLLTASNSNYGLYKFPANLPTTPVASFTVTRIINPTATTPTGKSFAGIAFNPSGQIYMATKSDNRLYRMENNLSLTFIGTLSTSDVGNDLTSCSFPYKILPVLWKSFDVTVVKSNQVSINWEVYEQNNKGFYIEHSLDGKNWEDITYIAGKNNPELISSYSYLHINNMNGRQYYRIRQVDMKGEESYSTIQTVTLENNKGASISMWPNPASGEVKIINDKPENILTDALIYDLSGRIVLKTKLGTGINTVNISSLKTGVYVIKAFSQDGNSYNEKLVKQ